MRKLAATARRTRTPQPEGLREIERRYDLTVIDFGNEVEEIRDALKDIPEGYGEA